MGHHAVHSDHEYRRLHRRLDGLVTGAPASPVLMKILKLLYPAEELELVRRLPQTPTPVEEIAAGEGVDPAGLADRLSDLAHRGLVFDMEHGGRRYFAIAPLALGFFEFAFMRVRDDVPMAELARLFDTYMHADPEGHFYRTVFRGPTQIGRTLVREETLPDGDHAEVLDWECASQIVEQASAVAVSLCACRHKAGLLGQSCDGPLRVCLTLNYAAESFARTGFAEAISTREGLRVLEEAKAAGLVQVADNVQRRASYICNCCGCCCEMFRAAKSGVLRNAIVTSNWIAEVDPQRCSACARARGPARWGRLRLPPAIVPRRSWIARRAWVADCALRPALAARRPCGPARGESILRKRSSIAWS